MRTGNSKRRRTAPASSEFVDILRYFLLGFGGVSLFVGAFVIFNTLSITVAQRTRELATLRTLGASRQQVLRSVVLEGLVLGLFASIVGLALGVGLAKGIDALFAALGVDMPKADTVFAPRTVVVSLLLGTIITLVASVVPAIRATRVPAISAVREGAAVPCGRLSRRTTAVAAVTVAAAAGSLVYGTLGDGIEPGVRIGLARLRRARVVRRDGDAGPAARAAARSRLGLPSARLGGVAGGLARQNALRNPARTAATAAALMIGLTLVTFVAVLGRALLVSDEKAVREQVATPYVITSQGGWDTVPVAAGKAAAKADGVGLASSVRSDLALVDGSESLVSGVDPATIARAHRFQWTDGSDSTLASLDRDGAIVGSGLAERAAALGRRPGRTPHSRRPQRLPRGQRASTTPRTSRIRCSGRCSSRRSAFDASFPRPGDTYTFVQASSSEGSSGRSPPSRTPSC